MKHVIYYNNKLFHILYNIGLLTKTHGHVHFITLTHSWETPAPILAISNDMEQLLCMCVCVCVCVWGGYVGVRVCALLCSVHTCCVFVYMRV